MARQPRRSPITKQTDYARAPYAVAKITNLAGGLNTATPESINDNDLTEATNVEYTLEGRVCARKGCTRRFSAPVSSRPVLNAGALYRQDGTSRLVVATDSELFAQTPQMVFDYNSHEQFTQAGTSMDVVANSGSVQLIEVLDDAFETGNFARWASNSAGWVIDNAVFQSGTRSARGDGFDQRLRYTFFGNQSVVRIRVQVRAGQVDRVCLPIVFVHPDGSTSQPVVLNSNGRVMFHNGLAYTDFPTIQNYSANTWLHFDFRLDNGLFWLTVNGIALNSTGISLRNTNNVTQILVSSWDVINNITAATGTLWIDTVLAAPTLTDLPANRSGHWTSPVQDSGSLLNNVPLHIAWDDIAQANNTLTVQTRTSVDNIVWSAWQDRVNPSTVTINSMRFSQVRVLFNLTANSRPSQLRQVTVSHSAVQVPVLLAGGLPQAQSVSFGQLSNVMVICNGVDFPRSYDGATLTSLTTAPRAQLVTTYQNRLFLGKTPTQRSALFFSGLLAPHDYSSTGEAGAGQINVNPEDGDELMCLLPAAFALLVAKQHHTYFLQGYSPQTFRVSAPNIGGTVSHNGLVWTPQGFFRLDREGIWFTDFRQQTLVSQKIQRIWESLEPSRLHQSALYFYNNKVLATVAERGQNANNIVLVYDLIHRAWSAWRGWNASCFVPFRDFQHWHHFFGSSLTGNLFEMGIGNTDDGTTITSTITTKPYTFGQDQRLKRFKWVDLVFSNAERLTPATVEARADGVSAGAVNFTLPQNVASTVYRLNSTPFGRSISVRTTFSGPATLQSLLFTYFGKTDRPERIG